MNHLSIYLKNYIDVNYITFLGKILTLQEVSNLISYHKSSYKNDKQYIEYLLTYFDDISIPSYINPMNLQSYSPTGTSPTYMTDDRFRQNNRIPVWQTTLHTRNYDRVNNGMTGKSLVTFCSGYDMSEIGDKNYI